MSYSYSCSCFCSFCLSSSFPVPILAPALAFSVFLDAALLLLLFLLSLTDVLFLLLLLLLLLLFSSCCPDPALAPSVYLSPSLLLFLLLFLLFCLFSCCPVPILAPALGSTVSLLASLSWKDQLFKWRKFLSISERNLHAFLKSIQLYLLLYCDTHKSRTIKTGYQSTFFWEGGGDGAQSQAKQSKRLKHLFYLVDFCGKVFYVY
jgi:signal transduction histidine kinase